MNEPNPTAPNLLDNIERRKERGQFPKSATEERTGRKGKKGEGRVHQPLQSRELLARSLHSLLGGGGGQEEGQYRMYKSFSPLLLLPSSFLVVGCCYSRNYKKVWEGGNALLMRDFFPDGFDPPSECTGGSSKSGERKTYFSPLLV